MEQRRYTLADLDSFVWVGEAKPGLSIARSYWDGERMVQLEVSPDDFYLDPEVADATAVMGSAAPARLG